MDEELEQLQLIFEGRPSADLRVILSCHGNDVEAAAEAILNDDTVAIATQSSYIVQEPGSSTLGQTENEGADKARDQEGDVVAGVPSPALLSLIAPFPESALLESDGGAGLGRGSRGNASMGGRGWLKRLKENGEAIIAHRSPSSSAARMGIFGPCSSNDESHQREKRESFPVTTATESEGEQQQRSVSALTSPLATPSGRERRRTALLEAQRLALEQEESDLRSAIIASLAPSDRGKLAGFGREMSANVLEELMDDPAFVEGMDESLRAAIELQRQIDSEERALAVASGGQVYPGSLAPHTDSAESESRNFSSGAKSSSEAKSRLRPALAASVGKGIKTLRATILKPLSDTRRTERLQSINTTEEEDEHTESEEENEMEDDEGGDSPGELRFPGTSGKDGTLRYRLAREESDRLLRLELMRVKREAEESCLLAVREHLMEFIEEHPDGTYGEWIEELHPENTHEGKLSEGMGKRIDHRFFVEESDHRRMWNDNLTTRSGKRLFVPAMCKAGDNIDLLAINGNFDGGNNGGVPKGSIGDNETVQPFTAKNSDGPISLY